MILLLFALAVLFGTGLTALVLARSDVLSRLFGASGAVIAGVIALVPSVRVVLSGRAEGLYFDWLTELGGSLSLELDALSAFFLIPIGLVSALCALYAWQYLEPTPGGKPIGLAWGCTNLMTASMMLVVLARNGLLFLLVWEFMAVNAFFLVAYDRRKPQAREAGWTYLVAAHLGTAFLMVMFVLLAYPGRSLDFANATSGRASLVFVLALIGFGTKAGFVPLHIWLPDAHAVAPAHVSALMSGLVIELGIYGILRVLSLVGVPADAVWWAWLMIAVGLTSGVLGILYGLAQRDLKRLLAYSSIENIGIVGMGMGVGLLGARLGNPLIQVLGFAGALLHVLNHSLYKSMLFLAAGAVAHGTGTTDMEKLGGLAKRMPWVSAAFLLGAVAIAGLPPLNGFLSEFLIYLTAFGHETTGSAFGETLPPLAVIAGLALIGGMAAACFTKAFGIVFLGSPRGVEAEHAHAPGFPMVMPMWVLAAGCACVGLLSPWVVPLLGPVITVVNRARPWEVEFELEKVTYPLTTLTQVGIALIGFISVLAVLRQILLRRRPVTTGPTWGCGYTRPTVRMQYTAASFSQPPTELFGAVLRMRKETPQVEGYFPGPTTLEVEAPEPWHRYLYRPLYSLVGAVVARLRFLQHGRVQLYVLYIALTILVLFSWLFSWYQGAGE
jgi:formate hydrogenlyase subunit 3/multisubunit Na+/H+ antiporter MnhD subunit